MEGKVQMEFFDSHSHYNDEKFEQDREEIIKQTLKDGVTKFICAGYSLESSKKAVEIANATNGVYAICGISPNDIPEEQVKTKEIMKNKNTVEEKLGKINFEKQLVKLEELAKEPKVVAIGEIGLDYHWNKENKEWQKQTFVKQIELANKLSLPIVIHTREAVFDTIDILKNKIRANNKGIFHCCPLNVDLVREGLKLGFYISFAGPITFKNSKNAEEIVKMVPLDKILIETDSPYLAPEPKRGTRNDSRNVKYIAEKIAEFKGIFVEDVAKASYENAMRIFKIK